MYQETNLTISVFEPLELFMESFQFFQAFVNVLKTGEAESDSWSFCCSVQGKEQHCPDG